MTRADTATAAPRRFELPLSVESTLLATSVFWALAVNRRFFDGVLQGHTSSGAGTVAFVVCVALALVALHFLLLAPLAMRRTVKPLLALMLVATGFASHFMTQFGVYLDPSMLRNALRTDLHEARELFAWSMLPHLLAFTALPLLLLWRVRIVPRAGRVQALALRAAWMAAALAVLAGTVLAQFQPLAALMRGHKELRYLVTPANVVWSLASAAGLDARAAVGPKQSVGLDAAPGPRAAARTRPTLVVLVVGETARAANWGLNGSARQTTPELAALPLINFGDVTACGTNTEVSLPCMFAPVGRRDYDEGTIRGSESLLHVVARAGIGVRWRDNQSGCKGVCDGLPTESVRQLNPPGLCDAGRCLDEGLLAGLDTMLAQARGTQFLVLHMLGNHGPSYFRRYPKQFARFQPACEDDDLRQCSQQEIVNAYDNALLYTDHVLATLVRRLQADSARLDSAMLFVSDHGESLGENNLYLHGLPWAIAPDVQKKVPMALWLSDGFAADAGLDRGCLQRRAAAPASHDHLFHTLLGLLDVRTSVYEADWDLARGCRAPAP